MKSLTKLLAVIFAALFFNNIALDKNITNKIPVNKLKKLFNFSYHTKKINIIFKRSLKKK